MQGINSKLDNTEEQTSELEDSNSTQNEQEKKKKEFSKIEYNRHLGQIKHTNICIIGVPEWKEREKKAGNLFEEIIGENFPNLEKET